MPRVTLGVLTPVGGGDPVPFQQDSITVGRRESSDLCLSYENVSGTHCRFTFTMGIWSVEDLRSSNGVKVNGNRIPPAARTILRPGDEVDIAKHKFVIDYTAPPELESRFADEVENLFEKSLLEKAGIEKPRG